MILFQPADLIFNQTCSDRNYAKAYHFIYQQGKPSGSVPNIYRLKQDIAVNTLNNEGFFNIIINEEQK